MKNSMNSSAQQPMIVKYLESLHNGIQSQILSRYAIGYILRGTKYIYDGDKRQTLARGDVFYLGLGHHYIIGKTRCDGIQNQMRLFGG